ncbi:MAG: hypothetical protein ABI947_05625 [Chloroflexota bacterium]
MDDNLTILFVLADGKTPTGHRAEWNVISFVQPETVEVRLDPTREDLGVGSLLDDHQIVAIHVTWLDNYQDKAAPVLGITGTFRAAPVGSQNAKAAIEIMPSAVQVPYHPTGAQIMEWIATYMQDNVYHDGMES